VWIEGEIGDVSLFSMTTKEENKRRDDNGSDPAFMGLAVCRGTEGEISF
jgi:hypothetical protein